MAAEVGIDYPRKSTFCAALSAGVLERRRFTISEMETLRRFTALSLVVTDAHDAENYPSRDRLFKETLSIYHPELDFSAGNTAEELKRPVRLWLIENDLDLPEVMDWFLANVTWEHLMGGGNMNDVPEELRRYLRVEINGRKYGFPGEGSVTKWSTYDLDQQIIAYRMSTNYWFARAIGGCLGTDKVDKLTGLATIYQITSDRLHEKNPGEPLMSAAIDIIRRRDPRYRDVDEVVHVARVTGLNPVVARAAHLATSILSRASGKVAEWDLS